jgi:RNA binding exosome subunit
MSDEKQVLSTKQVAEAIGTDAKTFRVFLRQSKQGVGSGKRYAFEQKDVAPLKKKYNAWVKEREEKAKAAKEKAAAEKKAKEQDSTPSEQPADEKPAPKSKASSAA